MGFFPFDGGRILQDLLRRPVPVALFMPGLVAAGGLLGVVAVTIASRVAGVDPWPGVVGVVAVDAFFALGGYYLQQAVRRDTDAVRRVIRRFGAGDMAVRAPAGELAEAAHVAEEFNAMAERIGRSTRRLAHEAFHDPLTGLPNRNYFLSRLRASLDAATGGRRNELGVLCLDLDRFKNVNDTLGHPVGDELLSVVAVRLTSTVGDDHMVARLGGDEFTILMEHTSAAAVETMAGRVVEALRRSFHISGHDLFVTVSIGVALSGKGREAGTLDLLRQADIALYAAKAQGASRFVMYRPELDARSPESLQLESGLAKAIENRELRVFYQPEVELETGRLVGMEALVRWAHPTRGLVPPGQFIPLAEETGEIVRIGRWVLAQACADTVALGRRAGVALNVGVNVSAQELKRPDLVDYVSRVLARTGLPPHQLELEITESGIIDNIEDARRTLSALRNLGVGLAIDDFGTGYSSLSYLHQLPFTTLKIDRSFVKDLGEKETPSAVARAIVDVAGALGLEVVAEGIETRGQLDFLRALACQRGQGYLFAKPMPRDEFAQLVWRRSERDEDTDLAMLVDPLAA